MPPFPHAIVLALCAYALGSIPFGLLIARMRGLDIREHGSRNIGATNVWRVLGWKPGLATFLCDMTKGLAAVLLARWWAGHWTEIPAPLGHHPQPWLLDPSAAGIVAAIGCILGHSFPVWLRFHGGKGVATSLGVIIGMMPVASLVTFAIWGIVFKLTRYVSLASIVAALSLPMIVVLLLMLGWMEGWPSFYFAVAAALLIVVRHSANIRRLLTGTENRFGRKAAEEVPETP